MSYNIITNNYQILKEGIEFIQNKYQYYDMDKLKDTYSNEPYSLQMIENCIDGLISKDKIYKIIIFDVLIGNSDRHHSNWAIINKRTESEKFNNVIDISLDLAPLYDNGSSLCAYVNEEDVDNILKYEKRFNSLIYTKSKSTIGWENERPIKHFELLKKLRENSYILTVPYIEKIKKNINAENIDKILNEFNNNIISENMKKLITSYLLERRKRMLEIYNLEG